MIILFHTKDNVIKNSHFKVHLHFNKTVFIVLVQYYLNKKNEFEYLTCFVYIVKHWCFYFFKFFYLIGVSNKMIIILQKTSTLRSIRDSYFRFVVTVTHTYTRVSSNNVDFSRYLVLG